MNKKIDITEIESKEIVKELSENSSHDFVVVAHAEMMRRVCKAIEAFNEESKKSGKKIFILTATIVVLTTANIIFGVLNLWLK